MVSRARRRACEVALRRGDFPKARFGRISVILAGARTYMRGRATVARWSKGREMFVKPLY